MREASPGGGSPDLRRMGEWGARAFAARRGAAAGAPAGRAAPRVREHRARARERGNDGRAMPLIGDGRRPRVRVTDEGSPTDEP